MPLPTLIKSGFSILLGDIEDLRKQFITQLNQIVKYKDQLFQFNQFAEEDLAAVINYQGSVAISKLVLDEMQQFTTVNNTLA